VAVKPRGEIGLNSGHALNSNILELVVLENSKTLRSVVAASASSGVNSRLGNDGIGAYTELAPFFVVGNVNEYGVFGVAALGGTEQFSIVLYLDGDLDLIGGVNYLFSLVETPFNLGGPGFALKKLPVSSTQIGLMLEGGGSSAGPSIATSSGVLADGMPAMIGVDVTITAGVWSTNFFFNGAHEAGDSGAFVPALDGNTGSVLFAQLKTMRDWGNTPVFYYAAILDKALSSGEWAALYAAPWDIMVGVNEGAAPSFFPVYYEDLTEVRDGDVVTVEGLNLDRVTDVVGKFRDLSGGTDRPEYAQPQTVTFQDESILQFTWDGGNLPWYDGAGNGAALYRPRLFLTDTASADEATEFHSYLPPSGWAVFGNNAAPRETAVGDSLHDFVAGAAATRETFVYEQVTTPDDNLDTWPVEIAADYTFRSVGGGVGVHSFKVDHWSFAAGKTGEFTVPLYGGLPLSGAGGFDNDAFDADAFSPDAYDLLGGTIPGTSLSPAQLQHAATLDAGLLIVSHVMSPDGISHIQLLDAGSLAGAVPVSPDAIDQGHALGNTSISEAAAVSPAPLEHGHLLAITTISERAQLSPVSVSTSHLLDGTILVQASVVTPNQVLQVSTLASTAVSEAAAISPVGIAQGQSLDTSGLASNGSISPNSISQQMLLDITAILVAAVVSPESLSQSQTVDSPLFSASYSLTPNALVQAQDLATTSAVVSGFLTPAGLLHLQVVGGGSLQQANVLSPADVSILQTITQAGLSQSIPISPVDITHPHLLDGAAIEVASALSPEGVLHAQILDVAALATASSMSPVGLLHSHLLSAVTIGRLTIDPDLIVVVQLGDKVYMVSTSSLVGVVSTVPIP